MTIGGAAVPEPASIISGLIAMLTLAGFHGAAAVAASSPRRRVREPLFSDGILTIA